MAHVHPFRFFFKRMSNVLPWIGLGVTIFLYLAVVFFPADVEARAKAWIRKARGFSELGWRKWDRDPVDGSEIRPTTLGV